MSTAARAAINLAIKLDPLTAPDTVVQVLTEWLADTYGLGLESAEHGGRVVDWRAGGPDEDWACQLVVADATEQTKRIVTVVRDSADAVAFLEDLPLVASATPRALVDLPTPFKPLLRHLVQNAASPFPRSESDRLQRSGHCRARAPHVGTGRRASSRAHHRCNTR